MCVQVDGFGYFHVRTIATHIFISVCYDRSIYSMHTHTHVCASISHHHHHHHRHYYCYCMHAHRDTYVEISKLKQCDGLLCSLSVVSDKQSFRVSLSLSFTHMKLLGNTMLFVTVAAAATAVASTRCVLLVSIPQHAFFLSLCFAGSHSLSICFAL